MISELGRRLTLDLEAPARERPDSATSRPARPIPDGAADPDFALSLSSAALKLAGGSAPDPAPADPAPSPSDSPDPATPPETRRADRTSRAVDAYREIARAPVGERIRIVV